MLLNSLGIYGGGEFFVLELASYLKAKGHQVWVGCKKESLLYKKCSQSEIKTAGFDFPENGKGKLKKNIGAVKDFVLSNKIQIVHTNTNYDRTAGALAAQLARAEHVASVHSLQSISHNITHWARNKFFVDMFIADGEILKQFLIENDRIKPDRITSINLGIEPSSMKRDGSLRKKIRNEFGLGEKEILIGNLGRLVDFKGQDLLIDSFAAAAKENPNSFLMIVGEGEMRDILEKLVRSLGLSERVIFAGHRDDLQAVYSAFDIYAHTSKKSGGELFPFAVLYAMAAGLPVISTAAGEIPNIITDETGFVVERNNKQIADKLICLIKDGDLRQGLGNAGLSRLNDKFTLEEMGSEILKLFENILSKRN